MNKKQSILPPKREIERVCQIVSKPGFRRVNIGLKPNASEAEKIKYNLCKISFITNKKMIFPKQNWLKN